MSSRPSMSNWIEQLQSQGRYTFTRPQAEAEAGRSFIAAQTALRRLKEKKWIVSPRRGFYVIVPAEYRSVGSTPASWFIDDLMSYLGQPYYVGLLSAAAIHGAAHQQPMVLQVVTDRSIREVRSGKVTIQFMMSNRVEQMPVVKKQTETGSMHVGTPETTAFDLVRYQAGAGHLSNVATVLIELAGSLDVQALADTLHLVRAPDIQRLGYLLEMTGNSALAVPLARWVDAHRPRVVAMYPGEPTDVQVNERWRVLPNVEIEVDL